MSWDEVEHADSYQIWCSHDGAADMLYADEVESTSIVITGLQNGIEYSVWIIARNEQGLSEPGPAAQGIPLTFPDSPDAPVVEAGVQELDISWNAVNLADHYEVRYSMDNDPEGSVLSADNITELSHTITGLTNGQEYYVWIRAVNTIGASVYSPPTTGTPEFAVPETPGTPVITPDNGILSVTWTAVPGTDAYEVWYGTADDPSTAAQYGSDIPETAVTIEGLANGTEYFVWLIAKNAAGKSGFSSSASGIPQILPPEQPDAPGLSPGDGYLDVDWDPVEHATAYEIWYGTTDDTDSAIQYGEEITETEITIEGLTNGTEYFVWILAKNITVESEFSPSASATPQILPPDPPENLEAVSGNQCVHLSWNPVDEAASYEVWYRTTSIFDDPRIFDDNVTATSITVDRLTNGTYYYFWVKAKNAGGTSGNSNSVYEKAEAPEMEVSRNNEPIENGATIDLGTLIINSGELECDIRIKNGADSLLEIASIGLIGSDSNQFELTTPDIPAQLEWFDDITATVTFSADNIGERSVDLTITSNDPAHSTFVVTITAECIPLPGLSWTELSIPGELTSRDWSGITCTADGQKVAAVDGGNGGINDGYLYISKDAGATWEEKRSLGELEWRTVEYAPDGSFLLAAGSPYRRIMISYDDGDSWTQLTEVPNWTIVDIAIAADDNTIITVPNSGNISISSDTGATWTELTGSGSRGWQKIDCSSDGQIIAAGASDGYIYTSNDGGENWTEHTSPGQEYWFGIAVSADGELIAAAPSSGYIHTSSDSGVSWERQTGLGSKFYEDLVISADGTRIIASVSSVSNNDDEGIYATADISSGWEHVRHGDDIENIAVSSDGMTVYSAQVDGRLSLSLNGGMGWTGIENAGTRDWVSVDASSDGQVIAGMTIDGHVHVSSDSGTTWTETVYEEGYRFSKVSVSGNGENIVITGDMMSRMRSINSGDSWGRINTTGFDDDYIDLAEISEDSTVTLGAEGIGLGPLYISTNNGRTFTEIENSPSDYWEDVGLSSDGTVLAACTSNAVYFSTDGGITWESEVFGYVSLESVTVSGDGQTIIATGQDIHISKDAGETWDTAAIPGIFFTSSSCSSNGQVIIISQKASAGDESYLYISLDGGESWETQMTAGNMDWTAAAVTSDGSTFFAAGENMMNIITNQ